MKIFTDKIKNNFYNYLYFFKNEDKIIHNKDEQQNK